MALLFMEGFGGGDAAFKWDIGGTAPSPQSATPRIAGCYYMSFGNNSGSLTKTIPASSQVFIGLGVRTPSAPYVTFFGDGGTTQHISVVRNSSTGVVEIRRGANNGTLLASGTQPIFDNQWNYMEVSCTIADAGGQVHVRLNGQTSDEVSYTGDTKNGGTNTTIDKVSFREPSTFTSTNFSDIYVLNSTGAAPNNNFLGDVVVRTLSPVGNGNYSQLVGSDGDSVNNYLLVDEHPYSGTDYVGSATPGQKDSYAMTDLAAGVSTVYGVQLNGLMAKSDASLASSRLFIRAGGTDYGGTTRALTTSFTGYYELYEQNPNTAAAWTPTDVNNMESGMEVM